MKQIIALLLFLSTFSIALSTSATTGQGNDCFMVSPNPSSGAVVFEWKNSSYDGSIDIIIHNEHGKIVEEMIIDRYMAPVHIDLSGLMSGMYLVKTVDEEGNSCDPVRLILH